MVYSKRAHIYTNTEYTPWPSAASNVSHEFVD